jgi:glycoprotein-N-acetylgalactosamine 3-beta-galactosyltransferase
MVYTVHFPPNYENHNLRAQAETWGRQCDGFIAASNFTDHDTGSINLTHMGPETYGNMWQKVRSMWAYAYDHYREEFDYFHICGDDVYVVVDNLRAYLDGPEVTQLENGHCDHFYRKCTWTPDKGARPLYFGVPFLFRDIVPAGGAGYTLNRAALDVLVEDQLPKFLPNNTDSREDIFIGSAFHEAGIKLSRTEDADGGVRYGGSAEVQYHFKGVGPSSPTRVNKMYGLPPPVHGINGTSEQYISFHLKQDDRVKKKEKVNELIYRYHAILNDLWCG